MTDNGFDIHPLDSVESLLGTIIGTIISPGGYPLFDLSGTPYLAQDTELANLISQYNDDLRRALSPGNTTADEFGAALSDEDRIILTDLLRSIDALAQERQKWYGEALQSEVDPAAAAEYHLLTVACSEAIRHLGVH